MSKKVPGPDVSEPMVKDGDVGVQVLDGFETMNFVNDCSVSHRVSRKVVREVDYRADLLALCQRRAKALGVKSIRIEDQDGMVIHEEKRQSKSK